MDDDQKAPSENELEVEFVDIDEGERRTPTRGHSTPPLSPCPYSSPLRPRFSQRQRRVQLLVTASLIVLSLLFMLGSTPSIQSLLPFFKAKTPALVTPIATPDPYKGALPYYVDGNPSWGHLTVDGKPVPAEPYSGQPPALLSRGHHTLAWIAPPFPTRSCTVSVPRDLIHDTCVVPFTTGSDYGNVAIFTFRAILSDLSNNLRNSLLTATQAALDAYQSTETVQPGEYYGFASPCAQPPNMGALCVKRAKATTVLRATISFQLISAIGSGGSGKCVNVSTGVIDLCNYVGGGQGNQDCYQFCSGIFFGATSGNANAWRIQAVVSLSWQYSTPDGKPINQNQVGGTLEDEPGNVYSEYLITLLISWDEQSQSWHVAILQGNPNISNPVCGSATDRMISDPSLISSTGGYNGFSSLNIPGANPAAGCAAVAMVSSNPSTPAIVDLTSALPICFYRFGVLLAANDAAHKLWPTLPMADSYEQKLATQIIAPYVHS